MFASKLAITKREYQNKSPQGTFFIPSWAEATNTQTDNRLKFENKILDENLMVLYVEANYIKTEQGDSGGPVFICGLDNHCKMIAVISAYDTINNKLYILLAPTFELSSLNSQNIKPVPPKN